MAEKQSKAYYDEDARRQKAADKRGSYSVDDQKWMATTGSKEGREKFLRNSPDARKYTKKRSGRKAGAKK